ncbi:hypothetical protein mRhiFer1_009270 [Rhinolophus ferrumequinum]|uniref:Uncharacterized protein n=1 Tax=Rhinolophus ferrumequinum TaxID=59479 RepID=A0A7J7S8L2_RHIFE|nr:hypothetical protein mRhiFer1_009270 [Rhinolophus ferrumequinum]
MAWIPASHPGFAGRSEWKGWGPLALAAKSGLGVPEPRRFASPAWDPKNQQWGRAKGTALRRRWHRAHLPPAAESEPAFPGKSLSWQLLTPPGGRGPLVLPSHGTVDIFHKVAGRARKVDGFTQGAVHTAALGGLGGDLQSPPKRLVTLLAPPCGSSLHRDCCVLCVGAGRAFLRSASQHPLCASPLR